MIFTDSPEINPNLTLDDLPGTFGDAVGASAESALYNSPTWQLKRTWDDNQAPKGAKLDYEAARAKSKEAGVDIQIDPKGMTEGELGMLIERKRLQDRTRDALARGPHGFTSGAAYFMSGLGAAMLDPVNLASAFIPVARGVGMTSDLLRAGRLGEVGAAATTGGRVAARLRVGAVEGAVGQALLEPLTAYRATQEQEDYGITDTLMNVGFGAVLGAVAHAGLGALGDRVAYAERGRKAGELIDAAKTAPERAAFAPDSAAAKLQASDMETNAALFRSEVAAAADGRIMDNSVLVGEKKVTFDDIMGAGEAKADAPRTETFWAEQQLKHEAPYNIVDGRAVEKANTFEVRAMSTEGVKEVLVFKSKAELDGFLKKQPEGVVVDEAKYKAEQAKKNPPIDPIKVQQAAIASHLPENDVHYDATSKAEVDKEIAAKVEKEDPAEFVAQVTQEAQDELNVLAKQLGVDLEKNAAMRGADEVTATASRYSKAIEAYVSCQART